MDNQNKQYLRSMTRGAYDIQQLRIQMGNRITANFKHKLGIQPGEKEELSDSKVNKILSNLRKEFDKITDGAVTSIRKGSVEYLKDGLISNWSELSLVNQYVDLLKAEKAQFKRLEHTLKTFEIYNEFLVKVKGCGPAMSAVIISEIDIEKAKYVSSIWKYAGLDVVKGEGRSKRQEHLEEYEYEDSEGNTKTKKGITFNPFLKTKLVGVLGSSFLRSQSEYSDAYYDYKNRIKNMKDHQDKTDLHIHNMANRYMVKIFLQDLYSKWKEVAGLPAHPPYHEAKLGHKHAS